LSDPAKADFGARFTDRLTAIAGWQQRRRVAVRYGDSNGTAGK
jgi:hypothetical protein